MGRQWKERKLPVDEDGVIPSPVDPDYECVPVALAGEPPPGGHEEPPGPRLCPDGYVPRLRRREYDLDGKVIRSHGPAEHNPDADNRTAPDQP